MVLPVDVLHIIISFCPLKTRYRCSFLGRLYFPFVYAEWSKYGISYKLHDATRAELRLLCERNYRSQRHISRRLNTVWSHHFSAPLAVWSPWTIKRYCWHGVKKMDFIFREHHFVSFVRRLGHKCNITTPCLRKINHHDCVIATVWFSSTKRMEMTLLSKGTKKKRFCVNSYLRPYEKSRALLEFCVVQERLTLRIQKLDFVV